MKEKAAKFQHLKKCLPGHWLNLKVMEQRMSDYIQ